MAKRSAARKPKKLNYLLIERQSDTGGPLYDLLEELVDEHHKELREARIALAWNLSWQPDVDGRCILGKCVKASDLDRELAPFDFVILLRREFWEDLKTTPVHRRALLDHELCHGTVTYDADGEPVIDQRGRTVYRMRKHDLEEFSEIAERYGCWKKDIEAFAGALDRARQAVGPDEYVGYTSVRESLRSAGLTLPLEVIGEWTEAERREAKEWAYMQRELRRMGGNPGAVTMPSHVAAAAEKATVTA